MSATLIKDIQNELGAAVLEVACPYKDCPAGKGAKCRTKSIYNMRNERVKGGNERDSVHHVRYKAAKEAGLV